MQEQVNWPPPGKYVVAVSGGVDSIALLDLLVARGNYDLVVAHFDHGIRADSALDAVVVAEAAQRYGQAYESTAARLGRVSEATAREARYLWLDQVKIKHQAAAIITAHHQDDLLETSLLNLARGSGRTGLVPFETSAVIRPLITVTKAQLQDHAVANKLTWREDSTNLDLANPRNFLRHKLLPRADAAWREQYLGTLHRLSTLNRIIDTQMQSMLQSARRGAAYRFPITQLSGLSEAARRELLHAAVRGLRPDVELDRRLLGELAWFAVNARPGKRRPIRIGLEITRENDEIVIKMA